MVLLSEAYLEGRDHQRAALALRKGSELLAARGLASATARAHLVAAEIEASRPGGDAEQAGGKRRRPSSPSRSGGRRPRRGGRVTCSGGCFTSRATVMGR